MDYSQISCVWDDWPPIRCRWSNHSGKGKTCKAFGGTFCGKAASNLWGRIGCKLAHPWLEVIDWSPAGERRRLLLCHFFARLFTNSPEWMRLGKRVDWRPPFSILVITWITVITLSWQCTSPQEDGWITIGCLHVQYSFCIWAGTCTLCCECFTKWLSEGWLHHVIMTLANQCSRTSVPGYWT